ncbi:uncharacterized protein LOC122154674 isoform X5 [Tyto alba]|nr:uncharacterized protein LOC122153135 isoform X5 [Tyto alba]XP_042660958.1 uncharacterized protein LOC122154670 isoform X5 [Tyto alba]XP_042660964.1 uncharacterized protein LOC122154674 isoform X5 [Tyto alba]
MVPTHRLLLILLLLVALHARAAGTALWKAWGTEGDAALQLGSGSATAGDGTGVPDGRTFPAPRLDPAQESGWHPRETDAVAVQESAFPGGSSGSLPASASAREAMQAAE